MSFYPPPLSDTPPPSPPHQLFGPSRKSPILPISPPGPSPTKRKSALPDTSNDTTSTNANTVMQDLPDESADSIKNYPRFNAMSVSSPSGSPKDGEGKSVDDNDINNNINTTNESMNIKPPPLQPTTSKILEGGLSPIITNQSLSTSPALYSSLILMPTLKSSNSLTTSPPPSPKSNASNSSNQSSSSQQQQQQNQAQSSYNQIIPPYHPPNPNLPHNTINLLLTMITRLLNLRLSPPGTVGNLSEFEIGVMCGVVRGVVLSQGVMVEIDGPVKILGDIHGQYPDLLRLFELGSFPPHSPYLFLGDYVDRGKQSLEVICLLYCYKCLWPDRVWLLRGNHESASINRIYGFYDELKRRYSIKLWKTFNDTFTCLPVAALVGKRILCMHGGISPSLTSLDDIRNIARPVDPPDSGLLCDLLWSDPDENSQEWSPNDRGVSYVFGTQVVKEFNRKHDLDLIVRAHQVVEDGYEFFAGRSLVTLFSAPNYCGEFDNAGGILCCTEEMHLSFGILKPSGRQERFQRNTNSMLNLQQAQQQAQAAAQQAAMQGGRLVRAGSMVGEK